MSGKRKEKCADLHFTAHSSQHTVPASRRIVRWSELASGVFAEARAGALNAISKGSTRSEQSRHVGVKFARAMSREGKKDKNYCRHRGAKGSFDRSAETFASTARILLATRFLGHASLVTRVALTSCTRAKPDKIKSLSAE